MFWLLTCDGPKLLRAMVCNKKQDQNKAFTDSQLFWAVNDTAAVIPKLKHA